MNHPVTYNEYISKILLNYNDPLAMFCADKYKVREYVDKKIGRYILNELYGVYYTTDQIKSDLKTFPEFFVLKAKHGCEWNYICKDKQALNWRNLEIDMKHWLKSNFYYAQREVIYKHIEPGIICERYLEDDSGALTDYKIHCFNGKPEFINVIVGRFSDMKLNTYDIEWNFIDISFSLHYPNDKNLIIHKPDKLAELLEYSKILSNDFPYVRCDFYIVNNAVIFGELTFTPGNGSYMFSEQEDKFFGNFFKKNNIQ